MTWLHQENELWRQRRQPKESLEHFLSQATQSQAVVNSRKVPIHFCLAGTKRQRDKTVSSLRKASWGRNLELRYFVAQAGSMLPFHYGKTFNLLYDFFCRSLASVWQLWNWTSRTARRKDFSRLAPQGCVFKCLLVSENSQFPYTLSIQLREPQRKWLRGLKMGLSAMRLKHPGKRTESFVRKTISSGPLRTEWNSQVCADAIKAIGFWWVGVHKVHKGFEAYRVSCAQLLERKRFSLMASQQSSTRSFHL